ncbi:MAG: GNAT family N-acetyltransferase [Nocardioides sp.]|nr:GNAT family N-acetyltransferase [Nocardioides sp.]
MQSLIAHLSRVDWPVCTERLALRGARAEDEEAVFGFRRLPQVHEWITRAPITTEDFHWLWADPVRLATTLVVEHECRVVGDRMLSVQDAWGQAEASEPTAGVQAELGRVLDPAYTGRALATEAVAALIGLCFETLGLRRVVAHCFADTTASWRLMERVGCAARPTRCATRCTARGSGWTACPTPCWPTSGRRGSESIEKVTLGGPRHGAIPSLEIS